MEETNLEGSTSFDNGELNAKETCASDASLKDIDGYEDVQDDSNIDHELVNESLDNAEGKGFHTACNPIDNNQNDANGNDMPNEDPNNEDSALEYDPEILAAMEASLLEAESDEEENDEDSGKDSKNNLETNEENMPIMMVCDDSENDQEDENTDFDAEEGQEDESKAPAIELENEDELTLEGEPEIGETPYEMQVEDYEETPIEDDSFNTYDPLDDESIGLDETSNCEAEPVNSDYITETLDFPKQKRGPRGPYKKRKSNYDPDGEDFDPNKVNKKVKKSSKLPKGAEVYFKCNICCFPFDTLGELKVHKYGDHENEEKPSYLDLAEAAVMKLNRKIGVSRATILTEIMSDPSVTDHIEKARQFLNKALKAGIQKGRLRQGVAGRKGSQNYWVVNKINRMNTIIKYNKNKESVEYKDVDDFVNTKAPVRKVTARSYTTRPFSPKHDSIDTPPDPKNFGRGKRESKPCPRNFGEITLDSSSSSDDEISIISEKIVPKTKMRMIQNQKRFANQVMRMGSASSKKNSFNKKPVQPQIKKVEPIKEEDPFEDDEDLTCRICFSSFWYKTQILEHLIATHRVPDPEAFLSEKKSSI